MATRNEILVEARRLVRSGTSRRSMDAYLRERYGRSVGHATHKRLFNERVEEIRQREQDRLGGYKSPKKRRQSNYNKLVRAHFLPEEAKTLTASLNTLRYHEIAIMTNTRKQLHDRFLRVAAREGYNRNEMPDEWRAFVWRWYSNTAIKWQREFEWYHRGKGHSLKRTIRRGGVRLYDLIWKWFGHVKSTLPPEMQAETPKKHRRKRQDFVTPAKIKKSERINNLRAQLEKEINPQQRAWLRELIEKERAK